MSETWVDHGPLLIGISISKESSCETTSISFKTAVFVEVRSVEIGSISEFCMEIGELLGV